MPPIIRYCSVHMKTLKPQNRKLLMAILRCNLSLKKNDGWVGVEDKREDVINKMRKLGDKIPII
jgi:hypothetical protein